MNTTTFLTSRPLFHGGKPITSFSHSKLRLNKPSAQLNPTRSTFFSAASAAGTLALAAAFLVKPPLSLATAPPTVEQLETTTNPGLSHLIDSNPETINAVRSLIYHKLELGEDHEALRLIEQLVAALPDDLECQFLLGRLLSEMGRLEDARKVFDEILQKDPLSFEALFESAVLMDRCGQGEEVMERLRCTLEAAREEGKENEAREVRLLMAQMQYLQGNFEKALESYEQLSEEDSKDYRPYFCQGVIYTLLDRNREAREKFDMYKELSPRKFDVDAYVQTPLSRMKLFGISHDD